MAEEADVTPSDYGGVYRDVVADQWSWETAKEADVTPSDDSTSPILQADSIFSGEIRVTNVR